MLWLIITALVVVTFFGAWKARQRSSENAGLATDSIGRLLVIAALFGVTLGTVLLLGWMGAESWLALATANFKTRDAAGPFVAIVYFGLMFVAGPIAALTSAVLVAVKIRRSDFMRD